MLNKKRPLIMGIVNVTPDSFSDGGKFVSPEHAIAHGLRLIEEGADILDIGGESTRPNSEILSSQEEIRRVIPVIEGLKAKAKEISIDTRNAETLAVAIKAGATFINDVSALRHDPRMMEIAAASELPVCLMHMKGTPQDMQKNPFYEDVIEEVTEFFEERIAACLKGGIKKQNIILDVGIGFGKTVNHNLEVLKNLPKFKAMGFPMLLGVSRKSFISTISKQEPADQRLPGSLAGALWGLEHGVDILRVHDVKETIQAVSVYQAISSLS